MSQDPVRCGPFVGMLMLTTSWRATVPPHPREEPPSGKQDVGATCGHAGEECSLHVPVADKLSKAWHPTNKHL